MTNGNLPFEVSDYNDGGKWFDKYNYMTHGRGRKGRLNIPLQRPDSPNVRLRQAGFAPDAAYQQSVEKIQGQASLQEGMMRLPTMQNIPMQQFGYAADRAIAQGNQVSLNEIVQMRDQRPGQVINPYASQQQQPQQQFMPQQQSQQYGDLSSSQMMNHAAVKQRAQAMLAQGQQSYQQSQVPAHTQAFQPMTQGPQVCRLYEGAEFYRPLNTGGWMQGAVNLCRKGGTVPGNWMVDFELRGGKQVYVVPLNENTVDIARIQANPQLMVNLVEVANPNGMIGVIYVQESAIVRSSPMAPQQQYGNRQMLQDAMMNGRQPQMGQRPMMQPSYQQPQPQYPQTRANRGLLIG